MTLGLGYNRRFHPEMTRLRQRIRSGELGTVLHVEATMTFPNALFLQPDAWRASRNETPAGGLTPMGVHAVDGMIDLCGPIDHVYCQSFRRVVAIDSDDTTSMLFRMKDGMSGYLGTMTATGPGFSFQVFGSAGSVRLEGMTHVAGASSEERRTRLFGTCKFQPVKGEAEVWEAERYDVARAALEAFAAAASGGPDYPIPVDADDPRRRGNRGDRAVRQLGSCRACALTPRESRGDMNLGNGLGHLTYSTLVHPGDTWDEMWRSLTTYVPQVKSRVSPDAPFGVSLRLANASAETLAANAEERERLKAFLAENDLYLYTVNAFPYGPFKGVRVKEQVYEPDWRSEERTRYTMNVADVLAEIGAPGMEPSIQTAPLGFKPNVTGPDVVAVVHGARASRGGASRRSRAADRHDRDARDRARAVLLPRDDRRDRRLLRRASLFRRRGHPARRARRPAGVARAHGAPPPPRHRVRHLPPGRRVRGHVQLARSARRLRGFRS